MFKLIQRGDHFIDPNGAIVIVTEVTANRISYKRKGYEHPCVSSIDRFNRDFELISPQEERELDKAEQANKTRAHLQALRQQIKESCK